MKFSLSLLFCLISNALLIAQITLEANTIPKIGDELEYTLFENFEDTLSYVQDGENVTWNIPDLEVTGSMIESYRDITGSALADSFPSANMLLDLDGFEAAAIRQSNSLEIIGVSTAGFGAFEVDAAIEFADPYILRNTPFTYGDSYEDDFEIIITLDADEIPGLDSLDLSGSGIPGDLSGVRITSTLSTSVEAVGWGNLNIYNESLEVLKIKQTDTNSFKAEIGISLLGLPPVWLDIADLGFDAGFGVEEDVTTTYKFLGNQTKRSIVEFDENRFQDTLGNNFLTVSGRVSAGILSEIDEISFNAAGYKLFPNPSSDYIIIQNEKLNRIKSDISIFSIDGQLVQQINKYELGQRINTSEMSDGNYVLSISNSEERYLSRIVIQH